MQTFGYYQDRFSLENKKRVNIFLEVAKKFNPDIITLQEVWLNRYLKQIKKELKEYKTPTQRTKW